MTSVVGPFSCQVPQEYKNIYYILTENHPYGNKIFPAGSMCYLNERTYLQHISSDMPPTRFWKFVMLADDSVATMDVETLQPLNRNVADFLSAISSPQERLNFFLEKHGLDAAMKAQQGQQVLVELDQQTFSGTISYIGKLNWGTLPSGLCPVYFGVELQGDGDGKGNCDGSFRGTHYFKCKQNCGIFLPCNKLQFVPAPEKEEAKPEEKPDTAVAAPVEVGDSVGFYLDDLFTRGIVMAVFKEDNNWMVKICPEEEASGDVFRVIPLDSVVKKELLFSVFEVEADSRHQEHVKRKRSESLEDRETELPSLGVNSVVQINMDGGHSVTGTIRWIGSLSKTSQKMAGVELDEEKGVSDGEWQGVRYFTCPPKQGLFVRLESCQPDMRFQHSSHISTENPELGGSNTPEVLSNSPPLKEDDAVRVLRGRMRGIQGHCNSCYMDAALFSF